MTSVSADTSKLLQPRIIPHFTISRDVLDQLKKTSPLHFEIALLCLKTGRWRLEEQIPYEDPRTHQGMN